MINLSDLKQEWPSNAAFTAWSTAVFINFRLTLKKIESGNSVLSSLAAKLKRLLRIKAKETEAAVTSSVGEQELVSDGQTPGLKDPTDGDRPDLSGSSAGEEKRRECMVRQHSRGKSFAYQRVVGEEDNEDEVCGAVLAEEGWWGGMHHALCT